VAGGAEGVGDVRVRDVMTARLVTARPDEPLKDVAARMVEAGVSALPVVDEAGRLVGIVTEADVISKEAYGGPRRRALQLVLDYFAGRDPQWLRKAAGWTAADVMTRQVVTAEPDEDLRAAARRMLEVGVKRLVVVDGERPVGIVSRRDLMRVFARPDEQVAADVAAVLRDIRRVPEDIEVTADVESGRVRLRGTVAHPSDARVVEHAVAGVPGVIGVESHLQAREPEPTV
jgi:CBS domain-containing protein